MNGCFPFAQKDSHKKASCKALVMANAYSNVIIDQIEECVKKVWSATKPKNGKIIPI